jgi:hypothetical protein
VIRGVADDLVEKGIHGVRDALFERDLEEITGARAFLHLRGNPVIERLHPLFPKVIAV